MKFTVTGPHMLAKTLLDAHYGSAERLADAIASVLAEQVAQCDAEVIQLDEANLPGSPDEWPWAAAALNRVLRAVKTKAAVHLCFGNYGGQSIQRGTWGKLIDFLNALAVDHVVMECAHRPVEELEVFRELRPEIGMGLGVVDIKRTEVETAEQIARAIERAGGDAWRRTRALHPPGLRVLDAEAEHRGREDRGPGQGAGFVRGTDAIGRTDTAGHDCVGPPPYKSARWLRR